MASTSSRLPSSGAHTPNKLTIRKRARRSRSMIKQTTVVTVLADRMINRITHDHTLCGFTDHEIYTILDAAQHVLTPIPALVEVEAPMLIFGDIHGQLTDLLRFFTIVGTPKERRMLFLGDYVDRCKRSFEVITLLLCYKIRYPDKLHLLRGNHECAKMNRIYGFHEELRRKRSVKMWIRFNEVFNELPLCANVGGVIFAMHGGISPDISGWSVLRNYKKPKTPKECDEGLAVDLMWADPTNDPCVGFQHNAQRSISYIFGQDSVTSLCVALGIGLIVRAHEVSKNGHQFFFENLLVTVFSAPNYCGLEGNSASVLKLNSKKEVSFITLKPRLNVKLLSDNQKAALEKQAITMGAKSPDPSAGVTVTTTTSTNVTTTSTEVKTAGSSSKESRDMTIGPDAPGSPPRMLTPTPDVVVQNKGAAAADAKSDAKKSDAKEAAKEPEKKDAGKTNSGTAEEMPKPVGGYGMKKVETLSINDVEKQSEKSKEKK